MGCIWAKLPSLEELHENYHIAPAASRRFRERHQMYLDQGIITKRKLDEEKLFVSAIITQLKMERETLAQSHIALVPFADRLSKVEGLAVVDADIKNYYECINLYQQFKEHSRHLNGQLTEITDRYYSEACYEFTGYHGVEEWVTVVLKQYGSFSDIDATASAFGADITYTTMSSASRGNLDLMAWRFDVCFIIAMFFRIVVTFRFRLPMEPFATIFWWDLLVEAVLLIAYGTGSIGLFFLSITILQLAYLLLDASQPGVSSVPTILSMLTLGIAIVILVVIVGLLIWAGAFRDEANDQPREPANDYFL